MNVAGPHGLEDDGPRMSRAQARCSLALLICAPILIVIVGMFFGVQEIQQVTTQETQSLDILNARLDEIEKAMAERLGMSPAEFQEWLDEHSNTDKDN